MIQSIVLNNNNQPEFVISDWYKMVKNNKYNQLNSTPLSMKIGVIASIPFIIIGYFFGTPLLTAKVLLKYSLDDVLSLYISLFSIILGAIFIFPSAIEIIKIIVVITLKDDEVLGRK